LWGGSDNDALDGDSGDDELYGDSGADILFGDSGNDTLFGGSDDDDLYGSSGNDSLFGDSGNDQLVGGSGRDTLIGGRGNDTLIGGGSDTDVESSATGFDGSIDRLVFTEELGGFGNDVIRGFEQGVDRIEFDFTVLRSVPNSSQPSVPNYVANALALDTSGDGWISESDDYVESVGSGIRINLNSSVFTTPNTQNQGGLGSITIENVTRLSIANDFIFSA